VLESACRFAAILRQTFCLSLLEPVGRMNERLAEDSCSSYSETRNWWTLATKKLYTDPTASNQKIDPHLKPRLNIRIDDTAERGCPLYLLVDLDNRKLIARQSLNRRYSSVERPSWGTL